MKEKMYEEIVNILKDISQDVVEEIKIDDNLKEKGVDSLVYIQLLVLLEEKYNFIFEDEMLDQEKLSTITSIIDYMLKMIQQ